MHYWWLLSFILHICIDHTHSHSSYRSRYAITFPPCTSMIKQTYGRMLSLSPLPPSLSLGGAHGVRIETLLKLDECRSVDKKSSLLDFVLDHIQKEEPELLQISQRLTRVQRVKSVSIAAVRQAIQELQDSAECITSERNKQENAHTNSLNPVNITYLCHHPPLTPSPFHPV